MVLDVTAVQHYNDGRGLVGGGLLPSSIQKTVPKWAGTTKRQGELRRPPGSHIPKCDISNDKQEREALCRPGSATSTSSRGPPAGSRQQPLQPKQAHERSASKKRRPSTATQRSGSKVRAVSSSMLAQRPGSAPAAQRAGNKAPAPSVPAIKAFARLNNDKGDRVYLGSDSKTGQGAGRFYCGVFYTLGEGTGSFCVCGPMNGPQCPACVRYQQSIQKNDEGFPVAQDADTGKCHCGQSISRLREEQRRDFKLGGKSVTYKEMSFEHKDENLSEAQLQSHWDTLDKVDGFVKAGVCGISNEQCESCLNFQAYASSFYQGQVCACGEPFEKGMSQGTQLDKCRRCGNARPEKLSASEFAWSGENVTNFWNETLAGRPMRETFPRWHPAVHPNGEYTVAVSSRFGKKSMKHFEKTLIKPSLPRPRSAVSDQVKLLYSEDAIERFENRDNAHMLLDPRLPEPGLANPKALNAVFSWTPGRFQSWLSATRRKRTGWPLDQG